MVSVITKDRGLAGKGTQCKANENGERPLCNVGLCCGQVARKASLLASDDQLEDIKGMVKLL